MKTFILLLLTVITFASVAVAQDKKDKIEIGVQTTSLTLFHPDFAFDSTQAGIGARVTYNFNRSIAAEGEINFLPQEQFILGGTGNAIQAQFGVKVGKRFEKFGVFAKVRPGFISVDDVGQLIPGPIVPGISSFKIERQTLFTIDAGGVLELYPSRRIVVRFEAGDTAIRHPAELGFVAPLTIGVTRPAEFNHNFQFTFGVGFRLGDFPEEEPKVQTSGTAQEGTPRYEAGAQFTSIIRGPALPISQTPTIFDQTAEPGFGGRFTFNLTENIALEAEGNYYTRPQGFPDGGHMFQGQFGAKIGKRFEKWGLFGKARPGFFGFTQVFELPQGVQTGGGFTIPSSRRFYPSLDIGGVVEFYISRRWMARFDVGDTIIRYGEIRIPSFVFRSQQTVHNFQFSSGIGFRF
jgi:hypothetical protein